ncbi:MAG: class I SAM-dependent methyltransferase [Treponema sp.]|nr:class I SAM-dependent methyltransferase [Treponema sp.]MBR5645159.1 class I SAM-dependent methyltransferase [Treponema sp.]
MSTINNQKNVKEQYASAGNLNTRISIHQKYSTNKMGFGNWIFSNYKITKGMKVLELGCGTGDMWKGHDDLMKACSKLVLSDFSEGMLENAKTNIGSDANVEYRVIDIQNIPFEAEVFDVVIANMMLYHVPDIARGLSEVRRVLKKGGAFYSATFGEHGIIEYLSKILGTYGVEDNVNKNFTLQNGKQILEPFFSDVQKLNYEDSLAVTELDDLIEYIYSLSSMTTLSTIPKIEICDILAKQMEDGVLVVPKEYGMFCCRKN